MRRARAVRDVGPLALAALLIGLSLTGPRWRSAGTPVVAVLIDVSASVSAESRLSAARLLKRTVRDLPRGTRVGVIAFDEEARVLGLGPVARAAPWIEFAATLPAGQGLTDLGRAIEEASLLVQAAGSGCMVVATDGRDVAGRGRQAAAEAARAGVDVHVLPLESPGEAEVAMEELRLTGGDHSADVVEATAVLRSTVDQSVEVAIQQDGAAAVSRQAELRAGAAHAVGFLTRAGSASGSMTAFVKGGRDQDPGNNFAVTSLKISGAPRVAAFNYRGPLEIEADRLDRLPRGAALDRYDAILVRLDRAAALTDADQQELARYAEEGHGVIVTTADPDLASAIRGGPMEPILPVRLEPPRRRGDEAAVVLLLDRSGSMEGDGDGPSPFTLSLRAARDLISLLSDGDRYGAIAFDVIPHVLRSPGAGVKGVKGPEDWAGLSGLKALGGTDWTTSLDLALRWLSVDPAGRRHVVLVSDGRLAPGVSGESAGPWPGGVTLSTVSVGRGADRATLERLALSHGGRHDHVERAEDLPSALRREGARLRPPTTRSGPIVARPKAAFAPALPSVEVRPGSNLLVVTPKDGAQTALTTQQGDPLLVFGHTGWGSSAFLAADPASLDDVSGVKTGRLLSLSLTRIAGGASDASRKISVRSGRGMVNVDVLVASLPVELPIASVRFPSGKERRLEMAWSQPGRAHASFFTTEAGEYLVDVSGARERVQVSCPAERAFIQHDPDWAERLAGAGHGKVLAAAAIKLPASRPSDVSQDMAPSFIALAAILIFADAALGLSGWPRIADRWKEA